MIEFLNEQGNYLLSYLVLFGIIIVILGCSTYKIIVIKLGNRELCSIVFNLAVFFSVILLTIISAIRYEVGADYDSYILCFGRSAEYLKEIDGFEGGFIKLIEFFKLFSVSPEFFVGFLSVLYGMLFLIYIYHEKQIMKKPMLFFAIYLFCWQYMYSLNVVRSCISAACLMMCIWSLQNNKMFKLMVFAIIGFMFHRTTLIILLVILLVKRFELKKVYVLAYILLLVPFFVFNDKIISVIFSLRIFQNVRYQSYIISGYFGERNWYSIIPVLPRLFLWIVIFAVLKVEGEEENERFYLSLFNYNMIITFTEVFFELAWRMMLGTWIADYFVFDMAIKRTAGKNNRVLFITILVVYFALHFVLYAYLDQAVFPYETIFKH